MSKEKRPSVKILSGRVKTLNIGLIIKSNTVKQAPTINETQIGSTVIPATILVVKKTETEINIHFKIIFILCYELVASWLTFTLALLSLA